MATNFGSPIRYDDGSEVLYRARSGMPIGIDPAFFGMFDDFLGIALDATNDWTVVKDANATAAIVADTVGGELALTSEATTDDDGASIQGNETFLAATGKLILFQTRIKCSDADQTDLCFGLTVNFATNPEAMLTAADRIVFQVNDGDASILCKTEKNGTETSTDSAIDLVDATYIDLAIKVIGVSAVQFYINNSLVATHTTNINDDENMTIGAMSVSGNATGTRVTTIDYIGAVATR